MEPRTNQMKFRSAIFAAAAFLLGMTLAPCAIAADVTDVGYIDQAELANLPVFVNGNAALAADKAKLDAQYNAQVKRARSDAARQQIAMQFQQQYSDRQREIVGPLFQRMQLAIAAVSATRNLSIVVDKPNLAAVPPSKPLATAEHLEFHARFAAESGPGHQVLDLALDMRSATAPTLVAALGSFGPLASAATDLSFVAVLHGVSDLTPKPLAQKLREIQAANGRLDVTNARLQQGDLIATATGALGLTAGGTLTGELQLTVVNIGKLIPLLGIDRAVAQAVPQETLTRFAPTLDRLMPGLGNVLRSRKVGDNAPGNGANPDVNTAAVGTAVLGGRQTELEGQRAVTLTLRFDDGVASLGPFKLGQIPPLY